MENKEILEERVLPEEIKVLTSKRYTTTNSGTVLKETKVAFCDWCGFRLTSGKNIIICCICSRKLCDSSSCAIIYEGKHYCEEDLQQILPLSRLQFKIIHGLINELEVNIIKDLIHLQKENFNSAIDWLRDNNYIEKKGISLFAYYEVLELGVKSWKTYYDTFSKDGDVAHLIEEIRNRVKEESENAIKGYNGNSH